MSDLFEEMDRLVREEEAKSNNAQQRLGFEPRPLLWAKIKQKIKPAESDQIKRTLGVELIDSNEVLDRELRALIDMVFMMQLTNEETTNRLPRRPPPLPEAPANALLKAEISHFVDALRSLAESRGEDPANLLPRPATARERIVYQQFNNTSSGVNDTPMSANNSSRTISRIGSADGRPSSPYTGGPPSSALSSSSSAASSRPSSSSSSHASSESPRPQSSRGSRPSSASARNPQEILQPYGRYLNAFEIDKCMSILQEALREEHNGLMMDINHLQEWLNEEVDINTHLNKTVKAAARGEWPMDESVPPTAAELRDFGNKLKAVYNEEEQQENHRQRIMKLGNLPLPGQSPSLRSSSNGPHGHGHQNNSNPSHRPVTPVIDSLRRSALGGANHGSLTSTPLSTSSLSSTSLSSMSSTTNTIPGEVVPVTNTNTVITPSNRPGASSSMPPPPSGPPVAIRRNSGSGGKSRSQTLLQTPTVTINSSSSSSSSHSSSDNSSSSSPPSSVSTPLSPTRTPASSRSVVIPSPPQVSSNGSSAAIRSRSRTSRIPESGPLLSSLPNAPVPAFALPQSRTPPSSSSVSSLSSPSSLIKSLAGKIVSIKNSHGRHIRCTQQGVLDHAHYNDDMNTGWKLELSSTGDDYVHISHALHDLRLSASDDNKSIVTSHGRAGWETFRVLLGEDGRVIFESVHETRIIQSRDGVLSQSKSSSSSSSPLEQFEIIVKSSPLSSQPNPSPSSSSSSLTSSAPLPSTPKSSSSTTSSSVPSTMSRVGQRRGVLAVANGSGNTNNNHSSSSSAATATGSITITPSSSSSSSSTKVRRSRALPSSSS